MAKVGVEVVGDSASLSAALGTGARSLVEFGETAEATGAKTDAVFAGMSDSALRLAVAQDKLAISTARFGAGSTGAGAAALAYRKQVEGVANAHLAAASTVGRGLTSFVTAPTVAIGYEAVKMATSFEEAMRLIQTQAGATAPELDAMTKGILGMVQGGHSFGQTASDMAQGLFFIESEGIRGSGALNVLKVAAAGAAVGQTDLASTTNALTSAMHVFGVAPEGAAQTMAVLNAAIGAGKLHMDDLNAVLGTKLLPTAKSFGITLPQILAGVDVFTKAGPGAASSATALTQALVRIEAPTGTGKKALEAMGLQATTLGQQLRQGGLPEALGTLAQKYAEISSAQGKQVANQDIFAIGGGSKGGASLLLAVQQYTNYMKTLDQVQQQSSPATFWTNVSRTMDLPSQKVKQDTAEVGASMIKLGTAIAPLVSSVAGGVAKIVGAFDHLPGPVKDATGLVIAIGAVGGPVILSIVAVTKAIRSIGIAFDSMGLTAAPAITTVDTEIASIGTSAEVAMGKVGLLKGELATMPVTGGGVVLPSGARGAGAAANEEENVAKTGFLAGASRFLGPLAIAVGAAQAAQIFGHSKYGHAVDRAGESLTNALGITSSAGPTQADIPGIRKKYGAAAAARAQAYIDSQNVAGAPGVTGPATVANQALTAPPMQSGHPPSVPLPVGPTTLTAAQQLALNLAQNPNDITFLNQKAAADAQQIAWLNKRKAEGKITAATYMAAVSGLYSDQEQTQSTIASVTQQAAEAAKQAAELAGAFTLPDALSIAQARAGTTSGLGDDQAAAREMKAFAEHALASHKLSTQGEIDAFGAIAQANSVIGTFNEPLRLQIAEARASTTTSTADDIAVAKEMKAFAEHALASKKLSAQGQIDALNAISSANSVIGTTDATVMQKASVETLTAGLGLTGPARKEAEERIAQALAHGGKIPTGTGAQGIAVGKGDVHIHGDIVLPNVTNGRQLADELEKLGKHSAVQRRGINAGRFRGHP